VRPGAGYVIVRPEVFQPPSYGYDRFVPKLGKSALYQCAHEDVITADGQYQGRPNTVEPGVQSGGHASIRRMTDHTHAD